VCQPRGAPACRAAPRALLHYRDESAFDSPKDVPIPPRNVAAAILRSVADANWAPPKRIVTLLRRDGYDQVVVPETSCVGALAVARLRCGMDRSAATSKTTSNETMAMPRAVRQSNVCRFAEVANKSEMNG
jgi:hypothetical protein